MYSVNDIDTDSVNKITYLEKRIATINEYYMIVVASRAFTEYFGYTQYINLTDFVDSNEKESLMDFIDSYQNSKISKIFHFKNSLGQLRLNMLTIMPLKPASFKKELNIEMVDIESLMDANNTLTDILNQTKTILGLTKEYTFKYDVNTDIFTMYKYDKFSKELIYKMSLGEWKRQMIDNGYIPESDIASFNNLISQIREYEEEFTAKITTSMRNQSQVMEKLVFMGSVINNSQGERIVIGRVLSEEYAHNNNTVLEMLNELSYDSLTNVYNKKTITEYIKRYIESNQNELSEISKNNLVSMAICIIDIDNFKKVNDVYGHLYGDKVLARIGKKLKEVVGDGGIIGRIGGDEFIVAFFDIMDENYLRGILRSIRTQIKWEFVNDFADFNITCSIGASQYPKNGTNYDELFKKADYCLYIAKEKGRDRYVFFRENLHSVGFEESQNRKDKKQNIGREMLELKYINHILSIFTDNKRKAIEELFMHIKNTFKVDSINVFVGDNLERKITVGKILDNSDNALYVKEESFKKLLNDKDYMEVSFIGKITGISPEFEKAMKAKDVISTIHVLIKNDDNLIGVLTIDRTGTAASKWADYEIESSLIAASLIKILYVEESKPVI